MNNQLQFASVCEKNHFSLSTQGLNQLEKFHLLLGGWNAKVNLISRKDESNIWSHHLLGSLSFLFQFRIEEKSTMLDLGTGGGLPGIPLAIVYPHAKIILLDSINKKIKAVEDIVNKLNLRNIQIVHGRAEEVGLKTPYNESVDYVITRAVSSVKEIIKWSKPWLRKVNKNETVGSTPNDHRILIPQGSIIMLKGGNIQKEIDDAKPQFLEKKIITKDLTIHGLAEEFMRDKKVVIIHN
jgi:16S rRNA (guanine527-N7)-methyltransferase